MIFKRRKDLEEEIRDLKKQLNCLETRYKMNHVDFVSIAFSDDGVVAQAGSEIFAEYNHCKIVYISNVKSENGKFSCDLQIGSILDLK